MSTATNSPSILLMRQYPDARRLPLVAESADWELLDLAMVEWIKTAATDPACFRLGIPALRVILEIAYVMGHERGTREATLPQFVVAPEAQEAS